MSEYHFGVTSFETVMNGCVFFLQLGVSRLVPDFRRMDFHLLSSDFVLVSQNGWKSSGHF